MSLSFQQLDDGANLEPDVEHVLLGQVVQRLVTTPAHRMPTPFSAVSPQPPCEKARDVVKMPNRFTHHTARAAFSTTRPFETGKA